MSVFVPLDNIPKNLNNLKIVQLSDIHIGTSINTKQLENIVCKTNDLNPDIITLTGDIIDGDINKIQNELLQLKKLKSKYGIYYVLGNHECYWNALDSLKAIKELGFITLENQGIDLEISGTKIFIAGMNDPAFAYMGGVGPSLPKPPQDSKFNLMLMHQPQFSKMTVQENYHLQLSGHTHGGQFFPWNFVVRLIYKISSGLGISNNLYIYVNQGTGYWGPPIRLGTVCEISQIFLKSK